MESKKKKKEEITPLQRTLNTWAIVLIIWAVYRHHFKETLPLWIDEFIAKPAIFLTPIYYYVLKFEIEPKHKDDKKERPMFSDLSEFIERLGINLKTWRFDVIFALCIGLVFAGFGAYSNFVKHGSLVDPQSKFLQQFSPWLLVIIAFGSALWEEILGRGFALKRMLEEKMNSVYAVAFNSFLYFFTHIPILFTSSQITGWLILQVLGMDIIFSVMVSTFFLYKRSTFLAILVHFVYNLALYFFI